MRARIATVLSVTAIAGLALAGCASDSNDEPTDAPASSAVTESSWEAPAAAGDRVGADGIDLQVWSNTTPDEGAVATLGDPAEGTQWVTLNVAQWVSEEGLNDTDVAPVLRSTADTAFEGEAVSPRAVEVPMTADRLYTYAWSYQVPEELVDPAELIVCTTAEEDAACSDIAE
ncbi:hypothetical protein [Microbacterium invictum]|uniref:Lipoprotein n=1 Tax=Microbacterium invictum TaxID=515415 RepID=A0AA40SPM4_9MICO|nr:MULTISPECIES: hypothetical protein [Microbacterium]MBB4139935.1 hypothetical protein [Microbacterium invictum]